MITLTVTSKGQITLRKDLLQHMGAQTGSEIAIHKLPNGRMELEAVKSDGNICDSFGMLKREGQKTVSIEEMSDTIGDGWAGRP